MSQRIVVACLLFFAGAATAQEMKTYAGEDGEISIDLPKGWQVQRAHFKGADLSFVAKVPGTKGSVEIEIFILEGALLTPRSQACSELASRIKLYEAKDGRYFLEPIPHLELDYETKTGPQKHLFTCVREPCRGVHTAFSGPASLITKIRPLALASGATTRTKLERKPPVPSGFKRVSDGDTLFLVGDAVPRKRTKAVRKRLAAERKRFEKQHGKVVRPANEPLIVLLAESATTAKKFVKETSSHGHAAQYGARRLVVTAWGSGDDKAADDFAKTAYAMFFAEVYGWVHPYWLYGGSSYLLSQELFCGKPAPHVDVSFLENYKGLTRTLDVLADENKWDIESNEVAGQAAAYLIFFRHGPAKYRKAFAAFIAEYRRTGDHDGALSHLAALGWDELRKKAQRYLDRKLKYKR